MASVRCLDDAFGFTGTVDGQTNAIAAQGRNIRNIIEGGDLVMSHILHFYHLAALDYIATNYVGCPISGQSPWWPKDNTSDMVGATAGTTGLATTLILQYVEALNIRREAHRMMAYLSGKQPCTPTLIPGGVTKTLPSGTELTNLKNNMLNILGTGSGTGIPAGTIRNFIWNTYIPTVCTVAGAFSGQLLTETSGLSGSGPGCKKYLAYGTFPDSGGVQLIRSGFLDATASAVSGWIPSALNTDYIKEYVKYSKYDSASGLHPSVGATDPNPNKAGAYSWLKAPRYDDGSTVHVCEVGPLARVLVNYANSVQPWVDTVNTVMTSSTYLALSTAEIPYLRSTLGRHAARAIECAVVADTMVTWINALDDASGATGITYKHKDIPKIAVGKGLTEAPRGALGHWIRIDGKKIVGYQCVVPTTWNASPKDDFDINGPIEQSLIGINLSATGENDIARTRVGRVIRAYDPCIACAVHIVKPNKEVIKFEINPGGC